MIGVLVKSLMKVATKVFMTVASAKLMEWLLFYVAEQIVKTTKTKHDDKFFLEIRKAYHNGEEGKWK